MAFYHSCLGGELTLTKLRDTPMKDTVPDEHHDKVVFAHLQSRATELSATDWMHATRNWTQGNTVAIYVTSDELSDLREIFDRLSVGADRDLLDELQNLPFGTYGHLADRFGVHWFFRADNS